jgi:hypothetical protein
MEKCSVGALAGAETAERGGSTFSSFVVTLRSLKFAQNDALEQLGSISPACC